MEELKGNVDEDVTNEAEEEQKDADEKLVDSVESTESLCAAGEDDIIVTDHPEDDEAASSGHDNDNDGVESTGSLCAAGEDDIIVMDHPEDDDVGHDDENDGEAAVMVQEEADDEEASEGTFEEELIMELEDDDADDTVESQEDAVERYMGEEFSQSLAQEHLGIIELGDEDLESDEDVMSESDAELVKCGESLHDGDAEEEWFMV